MSRASRRLARLRKKSSAEEMLVEEASSSTCPCGREVIVGYREGDRCPVVIHAEPTCEDFEGRDVVEYVTWLRRKTVGYFPGEDS